MEILNLYNVTLIDGDGIGPEITQAVVDIIEAAGVKINWDKQLAGARAYEKYSDTIPEDTLKSIEKNKVCLKAPITTPIGTGFKSVNVALRRHFDLYANVRPSKNLPNVETPFCDVDLVIVRENTEDIYAGIEHKIDGKMIPVGLLLPAFESMPIIDVGRSCMLEQLMLISIIIGNVIVSLFLLSFCIDSIALMPSGVAAPLIPRRFADMFIETYLRLSSERLFLPKILFIMGDSSFDIFVEMPLFSSIANTPIQIA